MKDPVAVPPDHPLQVTVWNPSLADQSMLQLCLLPNRVVSFRPFTGNKKAVISGQHTVKAPLELRAQYIQQSKKLPRRLGVVQATMMRSDTPVHCRQMRARDEQFEHSRARDMPMPHLATHLLGTAEVWDNPDELTQLGWALQTCGFDRDTRPVCNPRPAGNRNLCLSSPHRTVPKSGTGRYSSGWSG